MHSTFPINYYGWSLWSGPSSSWQINSAHKAHTVPEGHLNHTKLGLEGEKSIPRDQVTISGRCCYTVPVPRYMYYIGNILLPVVALLWCSTPVHHQNEKPNDQHVGTSRSNPNLLNPKPTQPQPTRPQPTRPKTYSTQNLLDPSPVGSNPIAPSSINPTHCCWQPHRLLPAPGHSLHTSGASRWSPTGPLINDQSMKIGSALADAFSAAVACVLVAAAASFAGVCPARPGMGLSCFGFAVAAAVATGALANVGGCPAGTCAGVRAAAAAPVAAEADLARAGPVPLTAALSCASSVYFTFLVVVFQ
jgi:hypothetical protein